MIYIIGFFTKDDTLVRLSELEIEYNATKKLSANYYLPYSSGINSGI